MVLTSNLTIEVNIDKGKHNSQVNEWHLQLNTKDTQHKY